MTHHAATWTAEQSAQLCAERAKGLSFGEIGKLLNVSRCAAIGKFDRLKDEGYAPALAIKPNLRIGRAEKVAEWMAENGGSVAECARGLGMDKIPVKAAWLRIRQRYGAQAT